MNADAFHTLRSIIREELRALRLPELAVVQKLHPHADAADDDNYACTVRLRDTGLVIARVPFVTTRKGMAAIPDIGDLVLVQFLGGEANAPVITGSFYNDEDRPPANAEGEAVLRLPLDGGEGEGVELRVTSADASSALLALGVALLVRGVMLASQVLRIASAALIAVAVLKVFLFDMSELEGVLRALSFIGLGAVLIGIGLFYQKILSGKSGTQEKAELNAAP